MSLLSGLLRPTTSNDATVERALSLWGDWSPSAKSDAGVTVTESTAFNLSAVWAAETLIADAIATLPVDVYRKTADARQPITAPSWIENPNPTSTRIDFDTQRVLSLLGWGNCYTLLVRTMSGGPVVERWVLDPSKVQIGVDSSNRLSYTVDGQPVPSQNMQHIAGYMLPGSHVGMSVVRAATQSMGIGLAADKTAAGFLGRGASASGVLQVPALPATESQDAVDRLREQFMDRHAGTSNSGKPIVLTGGTTWHQTSVNPDDAQLLETRRFQLSEVARWFRVPPHMIGDVTLSTSWGTGIEQQGIAFVTYTLRPWMIRLEAADTALLPRPQFVKYNVDALIRGDIAARTAAYTAGRNGGWLSVNDIRTKEDEPPIDGGDTYLSPLNMTTAPVADGSSDGSEQASDAAAA